MLKVPRDLSPREHAGSIAPNRAGQIDAHGRMLSARARPHHCPAKAGCSELQAIEAIRAARRLSTRVVSRNSTDTP